MYMDQLSMQQAGLTNRTHINARADPLGALPSNVALAELIRERQTTFCYRKSWRHEKISINMRQKSWFSK